MRFSRKQLMGAVDRAHAWRRWRSRALIALAFLVGLGAGYATHAYGGSWIAQQLAVVLY